MKCSTLSRSCSSSRIEHRKVDRRKGLRWTADPGELEDYPLRADPASHSGGMKRFVFTSSAFRFAVNRGHLLSIVAV